MSAYQIITDSTTDLSPKLVKEMGVHIIPLTFHIDGVDYYNEPEEKELSAQQFYNLLRAGKMSTTAQVNCESFKDHVRPYLDSGIDVLYLSFSSALSGTYQSAVIASKELWEEYPSRKILVVDTLAASMGEGLLVYLAVQKKQEGMSLDALADWVYENRLRMAHWFTVDDLNHLKRGGRISPAVALVGTMLSIKPVMHVDNAGYLVPMEKVRGRRPSLDALVDHMAHTAVDAEHQTVFISHGDCAEDCAYVEQQLRKRLGVKKIYTNQVGPVIGSHSGPGTVALFFLASTRG